MSKPVCTYCEQFEGVLLVSNLDDGDTQSICPNDLPMYALSMAAQLSQGMQPEQAEAYGELFDAIRANDTRAPKPAPRTRTRKPAPVADPPPAQDVPEHIPAGRVDLPQPCELCGSLTATGDADKLTCDGCGTVLATADDAA